VSISPDGQWIAYVDKVPGRMIPGISSPGWMARTDGCSSNWYLSVGHTALEPGWGLAAFSVMDTDLFTTRSPPGWLT